MIISLLMIKQQYKNQIYYKVLRGAAHQLGNPPNYSNQDVYVWYLDPKAQIACFLIPCEIVKLMIHNMLTIDSLNIFLIFSPVQCTVTSWTNLHISTNNI